jgi:hypothetical protein
MDNETLRNEIETLRDECCVWDIQNLINSFQSHLDKVKEGKETGTDICLKGTLFIPTKDCWDIIGSTEPQM